MPTTMRAGTVMCYGQTGAGKTHTMSGGKQSFKERGIIPRALSQVFTSVAAMPGRSARVTLQYLEVGRRHCDEMQVE
jgi:kinesin family protein 6/9